MAGDFGRVFAPDQRLTICKIASTVSTFANFSESPLNKLCMVFASCKMRQRDYDRRGSCSAGDTPALAKSW